MENPFKKLFGGAAVEEAPEAEEIPVEEGNDAEKLNDIRKRLDDLRAWQNNWTPEDRRLVEELEEEERRLGEKAA